MPRLLQRQQRGPFSPDELADIAEQRSAPIDALVIDGWDPTAAHRAHMRALNLARQQHEQGNRTAQAATFLALWAFLACLARGGGGERT